jgi:hypothetical protein
MDATAGQLNSTNAQDAFAPGALVVVSLGSPREKFFGVLRALTAAGVTVSGMDVNSLDDSAHMVRQNEAGAAAVVFFPMHRVERIELDSASGEIPSLQQRFERVAGQPLLRYVGAAGVGGERE